MLNSLLARSIATALIKNFLKIIDIVSLGPSFSITPSKIYQNNVIDIIKNTELSLLKLDISNKLKITTNFLKTNPDIFFTSADKGNLTINLS